MKTRVVIAVRGGVAEVVDSGSPDVEVIILDWDNISVGDDPGCPTPDVNDDSLGAAAMRRAIEYHTKSMWRSRT